MRDYGKVSPTFWTGSTGKSLRGDLEAQVLALYLMTCPMSQMTGAFHCPVVYMAHETGMSFEGAYKALARLIEGGFCIYDRASEAVFVTRMAAYQVADKLVPTDKRVVGLRKDVDAMPKGLIRDAFLVEYNERFALGFEAPSKPLRSQKQEQKQEHEHEQAHEQDGAPPKAIRGARIRDDWKPSETDIDWAADAFPKIDALREAASFLDYWKAKPGKDALKTDWSATFRNWMRKASEYKGPAKSVNGKPPIAQNFSQKTYVGTSDDELPEFLRS